MVNVDIQMLQAPDGTPVCNVAFDVSGAQLTGASHAVGEMLLERHRGADLEIDDVLALRELTGVRDELDRLLAGGGHARLILPLGRFIVLHDALDEYVVSRTERDWGRKADEDALPLLAALLDGMAGLRADALAATLRAQAPSS
jgi:hypothetical protein